MGKFKEVISYIKDRPYYLKKAISGTLEDKLYYLDNFLNYKSNDLDLLYKSTSNPKERFTILFYYADKKVN